MWPTVMQWKMTCFSEDLQAIAVRPGPSWRVAHKDTCVRLFQTGSIKGWFTNSQPHALSEHVSLCGSDFPVHTETGLQCRTPPHTAEGHRFYVPCMQLINFCYFVVCACMWEGWVCAHFCAPRKLLVLSAFCIRLISLSTMNSGATIDWDVALKYKWRTSRPLFIFHS